MNELLHDGSPHYIETSPLICKANQWSGFYMVRASVMKELRPCEQLQNFTLQIKLSLYIIICTSTC